MTDKALAKAMDMLTRDATNAAGIADRLRQTGMKGDHEADTCPVARFLQRYAAMRVVVGVDRVGTEWSFNMVRLPQPVIEFIYAFDRGGYSDLEVRR